MKKLKLDLHTHCLEGVKLSEINSEFVRTLIKAIRSRGLDGIALTEHDDSSKALRVKEIAEAEFKGEAVFILGREIREGRHHIVELFLDGGLVFRFLAHPGSIREEDFSLYIQGVEVESGLWYIDKEKVKEFARIKGLFLLSNSDAHSLSELGYHYNEIAIDDLILKAVRVLA